MFLHSMWRTSSTWLFTLFRRNPAYLVFYEPFNEALVSLDTALAQPAEPSHPTMDDSPFAEYRRVSEEGRIRDFDVNFAYIQRLWFDFDTHCERYLDNLLDVAADGGRTAVLQFNRSFLCLDYFVERYGQALHLYFCRNPRDQFRSFEQAGRHYYLGLTFLQYAAETSRNPTRSMRRFSVPFYYSLQSFRQTLAFYRAFSELDTATGYYVFFTLWCRGLLNARQAAFPVVATDAPAQADADVSPLKPYFEQAFPDLDLSDYRPSRHAADAESSAMFSSVEQLVLAGLEADVGDQAVAWLQKILRGYGADPDLTENRPAVTESRILDALRSATNANFAAVGEGLALQKR